MRAAVVALAAIAVLASAHQSESRPFVPDTKCENEPLASATSKPGFKPGDDVLVQGTCTVGAGGYDLGTIIIANGVLQFDDAAISIRTKAIVIEHGGSLIAGSDAAPFGTKGQLTITFVGPRPDTCPLPFTGSLDAHADWCGKGLVVGHPHWGGELKILHGFASVRLQGVELEKFGKARLGSYPIHLHEADAVATPLTINASSVHHSLKAAVASPATIRRASSRSSTSTSWARATTPAQRRAARPTRYG